MSTETFDSDDRRYARRQANLTEEACRIANRLSILLRRAGLPYEEADKIANDLKIREDEFRTKAEGRIVSRMPKPSTHPLTENRKISLLYLDESGTAGFHAGDPVFSLGGIAIFEEHVIAYVDRANKLKLKYFGSTDMTFHEPPMRNRDGKYHFNGNSDLQSAFYDEFMSLVAATPFTAFGVGIRKNEFKRDFVDTEVDQYLPKDAYSLSIALVMERFVDYLAFLGEKRLGRVRLESIGAKEDALHQADYADVLLHGTRFVSQKVFQGWVEPGVQFDRKCGSSPAELADLVAREVFEWTRSDCKQSPKCWEILKEKIYCRSDGHQGKFGVKVFPATDSEIDEAIREHRINCGARPPN